MRIIITAAGLQGVWMAVVGRRRARLWKCREMNAFRKVRIALVVGVLAVVVVACGSDDAGVATVAREMEPTATSVSPPLDTPTSEPEVPTATTAPEPTEAPAATEAPVAEVAPERDLDVVTLLPFDAIPAIDNPGFFPDLEKASMFYKDHELVLGVEIDGDARAYSVPLLSSHEIVNDVVGGKPIAVTW